MNTAEELKPYVRNECDKALFILYISFMVFDRNGNCCIFSHTLVQSSVQCFCCGLDLFTKMVRCTPCKQHKKFSPPREFVLGKAVGNISKYDICVQKLKNPAETLRGTVCRIQPFDRWLLYARGTYSYLLDRGGFFFTEMPMEAQNKKHPKTNYIPKLKV
uniref:Uncharacterized protein n=1 Tax=Cyanistes caeruleus TaxID=156563 RepID=A0A8C0UWT7_CYACU